MVTTLNATVPSTYPRSPCITHFSHFPDGVYDTGGSVGCKAKGYIDHHPDRFPNWAVSVLHALSGSGGGLPGLANGTRKPGRSILSGIAAIAISTNVLFIVHSRNTGCMYVVSGDVIGRGIVCITPWYSLLLV